MEYRILTGTEIEGLPDEFYSDVDKLGLGTKYPREMSGALIGAFDGDELVGVQGAILQVHCGPLWVAKKYRGASTSIRAGLWDRVRSVVREWGGTHAYMFSRPDAPQVQHIISKLPNKLVGTAYLMEV